MLDIALGQIFNFNKIALFDLCFLLQPEVQKDSTHCLPIQHLLMSQSQKLLPLLYRGSPSVYWFVLSLTAHKTVGNSYQALVDILIMKKKFFSFKNCIKATFWCITNDAD